MPVGRVVEKLRRLERLTRTVHPEVRDALERRWEGLPPHARTDNQTMGRHTTACEGTHGVFPKCDFACSPCYHSKEANLVRIDGEHTISEVEKQMAYLRKERGPGQYAQLIGGEVSLLSPGDHARALQVMLDYERKPMSFTHGDFDYEYLRGIAVDENDEPRFDHLSFAGHFDTTMVGRKGAKRPDTERELNGHRHRFCEMFQRLEREYGITHYLAHNMTVTPENVDQIPGVIRECRQMGWRLFSHQPAAFVGNPARWNEDFRELTNETVWQQIEEGAGTRLPYKAIQVGDERCNRSVWGIYVGDRYLPLLDDESKGDMKARDAFFKGVGGMDFYARRSVVLARLARAVTRHPSTIPPALSWGVRFARRAGVRNLVGKPVHAITFALHAFMDARDVKPAWDLLQRDVMSDDPRIRATQERLQACAYAMAHPDDDLIVPACVQHSVLDPIEIDSLREELPLQPRKPKRRLDLVSS
ncbi:MAG: radical SAM domain-containing protein [Gaiellaceae bacterium]